MRMHESKNSVDDSKRKGKTNTPLHPINIMILVASYPPIIESAARLYSELSESLSAMGHSVTVITEYPDDERPVDKSHKYYGTRVSRIVLNGVSVLRVSPLFFLSKYPGGKALRYFISLLLFTFRGLCTNRQDIILVYSPPLFMGISGYILSKVKKTPLVFNLQDIHPKVLFDSGVIENKFIKMILSRMEEFCYRKAHSFIVYSAGNKDYLLGKGVDRAVFIIPNWVDTTARGAYERINSFRKDKLIGDKFVVSYAGTMQQAQGLEIVVEAAAALKEYNDIIFILAGEGSSKTALQNLIREKNVSNVLLRPVMPKDSYIQFIYASDVCLVTLSADIPLQTVPGKLADIMACGKPIIAAVRQQGDAASIIRQAGCGFHVDPGDIEAFSKAVLRMYRDEVLRKEMGVRARLYAEQYFSRDTCTKHYEEVLLSAMRDGRYV